MHPPGRVIHRLTPPGRITPLKRTRLPTGAGGRSPRASDRRGGPVFTAIDPIKKELPAAAEKIRSLEESLAALSGEMAPPSQGAVGA
jgi:hypothetical protein